MEEAGSRDSLDDSSTVASRRSSDSLHQKFGLLADNEDSPDLERRSIHVNRSERVVKDSLGWATAKSLIFVFALCFPTWVISLFAFRQRTPVTTPASLPVSLRPSEDYVLDLNWDFLAEPMRREYEWIIQDVELNPDGVYRPMIVINGAFPGPLIECNEGDTIVVHVENQAVNATSIHWHGLYQNGTNWMDGTVGVTQCGIAPGSKFTYEFKVIGQYGTYHYHGHQGVQASDGLVGPFIIHSKDERKMQTLTYSTDRIIMIQDHYHDLSSLKLMQYLQPDRENAEPVPDGALLNGNAVRNCDALPHRKCDNSTTTQPLLNLAKGQNHRLRFINTGAFAEFQIQIDEHEFAVTEVDGTAVLPAYYHRLNINPAQRYSIILSTNVSTADSFWLRARMITFCFAEENPDLEPEIRAIVRYSDDNPLKLSLGSSEPLPESRDWPEVVEIECKDMNPFDLKPAEPQAPPDADQFFYIRANFEIGAWRLSRGFFNRTSWRPNLHSPTLNRAIDGLSSGNESFIMQDPAVLNDRGFNADREFVIQTTGIQTLDILYQNFDDGTHPLHLHGYKYFVLASGNGGFNSDEVYAKVDFSNPLRRDTASIRGYSWLLLRLVADNPGIWAFHCHVTWHAEAGLLMQFLTRADVLGTWQLPEANRQLCDANGLEKGAVPSDDIWYGDLG